MTDVRLSRSIRDGPGRALPPLTKPRSTAPSARPGGLDDVDGGLERRVYIQMCGIEQVRVPGRLERRDAARAVALVAPLDISQNRGFVGWLAGGIEFGGTAARAFLCCRDHEDLHVGI